MKALHIGVLILGLLIGYAIGARMPSMLPFIGTQNQ